jgi:hypothetical protein
MKNIKALLYLVLCVSIYSQSQTIIEIHGGSNIANMKTPNNIITGGVWKTRVGFLGGVSMPFSVSEKFFLVPGISFIQKGTKSEWSLPMTGDVKGIVTNNYLEMPIYCKYELADVGTQLYLVGGPSFGYLLSSRMEGDAQLVDLPSVDSKADYKKYDITFDLGLSSKTMISERLSFLASAMYSYGAVKVSELGSDEATRDVKLLIGLAFILQ